MDPPAGQAAGDPPGLDPGSLDTVRVSSDRAAGARSPAAPVFCPQLAIGPVSTGCQQWLQQFLGRDGLASTGLPLLLVLTGLVLIGVGSLLYRRSRVAATAV